MERVKAAELRRPHHLLGDVARLEAVDLVEADHDRPLQREDPFGDEPVAGADALPGREDEEDRVDVVEALVDGPLHAFGQRVARTLEARQVDEDELVVVAACDSHDAAPGCLRLVGDDRDLAAAERVYERRLSNVGPPNDGGEPAPQKSAPTLGGEEHPPPSGASLAVICARVYDGFVTIAHLFVPSSHRQASVELPRL